MTTVGLLALMPGDWDVWAAVEFEFTVPPTVATFLQCRLVPSDAPAPGNDYTWWPRGWFQGDVTSNLMSFEVGPVQINRAAPTVMTLQISAQAAGAVWFFVSGRRMR